MLKCNVNPTIMGKKTLLIIISLMIMVAYSQETEFKPIDRSTLIEKGGLTYEPDSDVPYSGKAALYYQNGQERMVVTYKNGKLDGECTIWYKYGQKRGEGSHKNGSKVGKWTYWHENGQKSSEGTHKNGMLYGKVTYWYENGQKKSEGTYKNGVQDGLWKYYREDGTEKKELTYKDESSLLGNARKKEEATYKDEKEVVEYPFLQVNQQLRPLWNFKEPKNPICSGLFSLVIPSGGHFYNEQYYKGFKYLFGVPLLYLAGLLIVSNNIEKSDDGGVFAGLLLQSSALFLHFYNVYDAVISSNEINKEYYRKYLEEEKALKQQE